MKTFAAAVVEYCPAREAKQGFKNAIMILQSMEAAEKAHRSIQAWVLLSYLLTDQELFEDLNWLKKHGAVALGTEEPALHSGLGPVIGREIMKKIVLAGVRRLESGK